jgi:hypothetical protein
LRSKTLAKKAKKGKQIEKDK